MGWKKCGPQSAGDAAICWMDSHESDARIENQGQCFDSSDATCFQMMARKRDLAFRRDLSLLSDLAKWPTSSKMRHREHRDAKCICSDFGELK